MSEEPVLQVIKGDPTAEELAAVVVVLSRRSASAGEQAPSAETGGGGWSAYWRNVRAPLAAGPGVWRTSGRLG